MNKKCLILIVTALAALTVVLAGCSGSESSSAAGQNGDATTFAGTWQLTRQGDEDVDRAAVDEGGQAEFLILQDGGTALYERYGDYYQGTYKEEGAGRATIDLKRVSLDGDMTIEGGTLSVQRTSGEALEFEKIDDAERQAYDEKFGYHPFVMGGDEDGQPIFNELGKVLVDDDICTITATDIFEMSSVAGYDLEVVNKTSDKLLVRSVADSFTIGGDKVNGSVSIETSPNSSETGTAAFSIEDIGGGIDKLKDVKFQVEAVAPGSSDAVATYDIAL